MNKKILYIIMGIITIALIGGGIFFTLNNNNSETPDNSNKTSNNNNKEDDKTNDKTPSNSNNKILVLYFSATGTTKTVAEYIAEESKGDLVEIVPKEKYTSDDLNYNVSDCRANKEQNDDKARPEISNTINVEDYDTIFIGYPIWWGDVPKIILTLLDNYNLDGKTVIPFCTSGGSSITQSLNTLKSYNNKINWLEGKRFSSSSQSEISSWIKELNIA